MKNVVHWRGLILFAGSLALPKMNLPRRHLGGAFPLIRTAVNAHTARASGTVVGL